MTPSDFPKPGSGTALRERRERSQRFNDTTGALTWNYESAALHPDACACQNESTPHKHYPEPPFRCARCGKCDAYSPKFAASAVALPAEPPPAKTFRIMDTRTKDGETPAFHVPFSLMAPHEQRAQHNHGGQTLDTLNRRGGLDPKEALGVLRDERWMEGSVKGLTYPQAVEEIQRLAAAIRPPEGATRGTGYMTTFTGKQFRHAEPMPEMVNVRDIAHHLSMLCHWGGASREFVSVAQHSVLVSNLCPPELRLWGLLHDAAEAYYGDVIRPLKVLLPEYKELETRGMRVIAEKFGLTWPEPPELKEFDNRALLIESRDFMHGNEAVRDGRGQLIRFADLEDIRLTAQTPAQAEASFLARFAQLADAGDAEPGEGAR